MLLQLFTLLPHSSFTAYSQFYRVFSVLPVFYGVLAMFYGILAMFYGILAMFYGARTLFTVPGLCLHARTLFYVHVPVYTRMYPHVTACNRM